MASLGYKYSCVKCGEPRLVRPADAGVLARCGACGVEQELPTLRGIRALPAWSEGAGPAAAERPAWNRAQGAYFAGGFVCALGGLVLLTLAVYLRTLVDTRGPGEYDPSRDNVVAAIQHSSPAQLWDDWAVLQEKGLGTWREPGHLTARRIAFNAYGGMAAAAALLLGGGALIARSLRRPPARPLSKASPPSK